MLKDKDVEMKGLLNKEMLIPSKLSLQKIVLTI
jgi:hypothetical protein